MGPSITATGKSRTSKATFTRPSDTTAYAAGDVVCNSTSAPVIMTFANAVSSAHASSILQQALLIDSGNETTKLDCELWLFDTTVVMDNDNAAFTPTDAEMLTLVAVIPFSSSAWKQGTAGTGGNCANDQQNLGIPINVADGTQNTSLYGILVARNAYTPISAEVFTFKLKFLD